MKPNRKIAFTLLALATWASSAYAGSPQSIPLTRTDQAPILTLTFTPSSLTFAAQTVGTTSAPQTVTVLNTSSAPVTIAGFDLLGANFADYSFPASKCGLLAAGASCTVSVSFAPISTGTRTAGIGVHDNATGSPQTIPLSGTGQGSAPLTLSFTPSSLTFAAQTVYTVSAPQTVTIQNTGSAPVTITGVDLLGANTNNYSFPASTCVGTLAAGASCTASVSFAPISTGAQTAGIGVHDNATGSPQTIPLSGTGQGSAPLTLSFTPSSLTFAAQTVYTVSAPQTVTIQNTGSAPVTITGVDLLGANTNNYSFPASTCVGTLAAGASCTASVSFAPISTGAQTAGIGVHDNATGSPQTIPLSGTGQGSAPLTLSFTPSSLTFAAQTVYTVSAPQTVTIQNTGSAPVTITGVDLLGANTNNYSFPASTCVGTLAAGASCTASVSFAPISTGAQTAGIGVHDNATGNPQTVPLTGTGQASAPLTLSFTPSGLTFAAQTVYTVSAPQTVTIQNTGSAPVTITGVDLLGANTNNYSFPSNTCGLLAAGASCTASVAFAPISTGVQTAGIGVHDNAPGNPQTVPLTGTGQASPLTLSFAPSTLAFAAQAVGTTSAVQSLTVQNAGTATVAITGYGLVGVNASDYGVVSSNCGATLAAGTSCTISIEFVPSTTGLLTASIELYDNVAGSPQDIPMTGTGQPATLTLSLTPSSLTFAAQTVGTTSATQTVTLQNTGNAPVTIAGYAPTGPNYPDFVVGPSTCNIGSLTLAAGASCTLGISFTPSATGTRTATLDVFDNAAGNPQSIPLTGTGQAPPTPILTLSFTPSSLTFASQTTGTSSAPQTVTILNTGNTTVSISSYGLAGTNAGDYGVGPGTCNSVVSLTAGSSCTIAIYFTPSTAGTRVANFAVYDNAAGNPQSISLTGTGATSGAGGGGGGGTAASNTFTVTSTLDTGGSCSAGSPTCTLRAATQAANAASGASVITVPAGIYLLSQSAYCGIRTNGDTQIRYVSIVALCLTGKVTINGAGAGSTIIDAQQLDRVMVVAADSVAQVNGVTLQNGAMNSNSYPFGGNGGGGGINNQGTLNIVGCSLLNNASQTDGGGIWSAVILTVSGCTLTNNNAIVNDSSGGGIFAGYGTANISYSTFHGNAAEAGGGGVGSLQANVSITSSTFDANTGSQGGAIWNLTQGVMTLTNVTISGNTAGNYGGGINNLGTLTANNVTIASNNAQNGAGGLVGGGAMTFGNSIISGNTAVNNFPDVDCIGDPIVSKGYNIVLNPAGACSFTGDQTGNLIGVDPLLTALQDNGGGTFTLALSAGSPAVDAGSPTAPGSGGNACALADQRGILRPLGTRCDIGAFERSSALLVSGITTNHAANTGLVQTFIRGGGFAAGVTAILRMNGQTDIVGSALYADPGGSDLSASFDLTSAAKGFWDVIVTNSDQTTGTLAGGFLVETAQGPQLWTSVTGPSVARAGRATTFNLNYGNTGNSDAEAVPLTLSAPAGYSLELYFPVTPPPAQTGQVALDWTTAPIDVQVPKAGVTNAALMLPVVPAGFSGALQFSIVPPVGGTAISFEITAPIGLPLLDPTPDPIATAQVAAGAQAYALANLGATVPNSHLPALGQYAANQLTLAVAAGRAALGSSLGGQPQVYSMGQFGIDVAEFAAANASALPHALPRVAAGAGAVVPTDPSCPPGEIVKSRKYVFGNGTTTIYTDCEAAPPVAVPTPPGPAPITPAACNAIFLYTVSSNGQNCIPNFAKKVDCYFLNLYCPTIPITQSQDPNDKTGPPGAGTQEFEPGGISYPYTIQFENVATATAAAQTVVVTDQLDTSTLDLSTFSLGAISFGNYLMNPVAGSKQYTKALDLRPAQNIVVAVTAALNQSNGLVTWTFTSLDPATQQLTTNPTAGFLPPNVTQPQGEAKLVYTINPLPNLATGTTICNQATVVFDVNAPIKTPNWCNTVDISPPVSHVQSLTATQSSLSFPVQWSGTDQGSGIADYTVYASDNGGAFTAFQTRTTNTQATFTGSPGHSYNFYSIAEDNVLNQEPSKTAAEATTAIPPCATDETAQFTAVKSGFRLNTTTHQYQQTVQLTNKSGQTLTGPFAFVVDSLSATSTLFSPAGTTSCAAPSGSPYLTISPPSGNSWNAGQSVTVGLNFVDPSNTGITYNLRVLAGTPIH